ncbi:MAG: hypothetical protein JWM55_1797 [Acidimicrobiaceae bacterium]|nr:hypothetical protein [Acidimicrobiaceae bacterium]
MDEITRPSEGRAVDDGSGVQDGRAFTLTDE